MLHACWDTGHANCEGSQYDDIITLGKELFAIHYNDNHGAKDEHLIPFLGTLNHDEIINALGLPKRLLTKIVPTGAVVGALSDDICEELSLPKADVIAVAAHDTQSAITAVPCQDDDFVFISCGTWSLFGTEVKEPIINEASKRLNVTNEGGYDFTTAFLKNIIGLWLIQESRRQWKRENKEYSYAELEKLALECEPFKCFIDPDSPEFGSMGNIPKRVQEYCEKTNQIKL